MNKLDDITPRLNADITALKVLSAVPALCDGNTKWIRFWVLDSLLFLRMEMEMIWK